MPAKQSSELELFQIAGVTIAIDFSWIIIFALILWSLSAGYFPHLHPGYSWPEYLLVGLAGTILFFASIVIHELAHAIVANRLGQTVNRISLFIFGGMAHMAAEPSEPGEEFKIAAVGPLTSLVLGGVFWAIPHLFVFLANWPMWASVFIYLGYINIALGLFNLLPGFPLDGGRILRAALWARWGDWRRATARAADWGRGIAYGLIGLGALEIFSGSLMGGLWLILIALFLRSAASSSYQSMLAEHLLSRYRVSEVMVPDPISIPADMPLEQAIENYFMRYGYGAFPVTSDGRATGIMSLAQVRNCPAAERAQRTVGQLMRPLDPAIQIASTATVADAIRQMGDESVGRLLVIDQERLVGLITRSGISRFLMLREDLSSAA